MPDGGNQGGTQVGSGGGASISTGGFTSSPPVSSNIGGASITSVNEAVSIQSGIGGGGAFESYEPAIHVAPAVGIGDTVGMLSARVERLEELIRSLLARQ